MFQLAQNETKAAEAHRAFWNNGSGTSSLRQNTDHYIPTPQDWRTGSSLKPSTFWIDTDTHTHTTSQNNQDCSAHLCTRAVHWKLELNLPTHLIALCQLHISFIYKFLIVQLFYHIHTSFYFCYSNILLFCCCCFFMSCQYTTEILLFCCFRMTIKRLILSYIILSYVKQVKFNLGQE